MWRVFLILVLLIPAPARAEGELVIHNQVILRGKQLLHGIRIENGGVLTIEAGAELTFTAGALIHGEGRLEVKGRSDVPILLTGVGWRGIDSTGAVLLEYVQIFGASGYFSFAGSSTVIRHAVIHDVPDSRLFFWPKDGSHVRLEHITIRWHALDRTKARTGVFIKGPAGEVYLYNLLFPRSTELPNSPLIEITEGYLGVQLIGAKTEDGCSLANPEIVFRQSARYRLQSTCKPKEPSLLFIPGYGASVNFAHLTNPIQPEPAPAGWSLLPYLTSSYTAFLDEASHRGINTATAHYDWRLHPPEAVSDYLIPAIDALKQRDNVQSVFLVAHSFGGLVARAYIESAMYRGDVAGLVLIGTPNNGSLKAYAPWQAAVFPDDWQVLSHLVRLYNYLRPEMHSELQALHTLIPSGLSLQPVGQVLYRSKSIMPDALLYHRNTFLTDTLGRVPLPYILPLVFTVTSGSVATPIALNAGERRPRAQYWRDGEQLGVADTGLGDGTVSAMSASLPLVSSLVASGAHMDLPETAATQILDRLYPQRRIPAIPKLRDKKRIRWFAFDCPITVEITAPSGKQYSSNEQGVPGIFANDRAIWMLLEEEPGSYTIRIQALENTPVRWWQGMESIHHYNLKKDEVRVVQYNVQAEELPPKPLTVSENQELAEEIALDEIELTYSRVALPWQLHSYSTVTYTPVPVEHAWRFASMEAPSVETSKNPRQLRLLAFLPILLLIRKRVQSASRSHHPP